MKEFLSTLRKSKAAVMVLIIAVLGVVVLWITGASNVHHLAVDLLALYFLGWALIALLSERPLLQLRKRFILVTVTLVSCLVFVETPALLGFVDYRSVFSTPSSEPWYRPDYVLDRELLWIHPPHHQQAEHGEGNIGEMLCLPPHYQEYQVRYDQNGFRNDTDMTRAEIAVVGDSYVEAPMLPSSVLVTSVLGELQKSRVVNLGVIGYAPQQELVVVKRYALNLQPKILVWVIVEGNLHEASDYDEKVYNVPNEFRSMKARWLRSFTRNSLWALLRLPQRCAPNSYFEQRYGVVRDEEGRQRRIYFPGYYGPFSERDRESLDKTRSLLAAAYQLCRERGIRLVVVFSPKEYRVYHDLPNLQEVSEEVKRYVVNDLPEQFSKMVAEVSPDIEYLDLTPIFRAEAAKGRPIFLPYDTHWGPEGHWVVAQALHRLLSAHGLNTSLRSFFSRWNMG